MTNEANAPSASPAVLTRSQAEAEATAAHRARYLAKLTPKIVWFVLPILAICINLSLIIFREPTPADFTIAFVGLCLCAYSAITFYRDDQKIRAIAQLTPIYDMAALRAQVGVLNFTVALLSDALQFGDPATSKRAVEVAFGAIAPLLARGPTTVENAVAAGYQSSPDVDVTQIQSTPDDLLSIHVLRIEACSTSRSEEHTSELQSLMRISYAVFCLKKKHNTTTNPEFNHLLATHKDNLNTQHYKLPTTSHLETMSPILKNTNTN